MSPKRGDWAAPPPGPGEWDIRFHDNASASGWEELCRHAPANTLKTWQLMRAHPGPPETERHHQLRGDLATRKMGGQELEQWQVEVTGGGRIWYCLDQENHKVWIVLAGTGHPRLTG